MLIALFLITAASANPGDVDKDMAPRIFNAYCQSCHMDDGKLKSFDEKNEVKIMIEKIRSGESGMPTYSWLFDDEDLESIIEYMKTLPQ